MTKVKDVKDSGLLLTVNTLPNILAPFEEQALVENRSLGVHALAFHFNMLIETSNDILANTINKSQFKESLKALLEFASDSSTMQFKNFPSFKSNSEENPINKKEDKYEIKQELLNFIRYHANMVFVPNYELLDNEKMDKCKSAVVLRIVDEVLNDNTVKDNLNIYKQFNQVINSGFQKMLASFAIEDLAVLGDDFIKRHMPTESDILKN